MAEIGATPPSAIVAIDEQRPRDCAGSAAAVDSGLSPCFCQT